MSFFFSPPQLFTQKNYFHSTGKIHILSIEQIQITINYFCLLLAFEILSPYFPNCQFQFKGFSFKFYQNFLIIIINLFKFQRPKKSHCGMKITRRRFKQDLQVKPMFLSLFKTEKTLSKQTNPKKKRSCKKRRMVHEQIPSESEKIIIDLDMGQYGFDNQQSQKSFSLLSQIIEICDSFANNPNTNEIKWSDICKEVLQQFNKQIVLIQGKNIFALHSGKSGNYRQLSKQQYTIWQTLNDIFFKIKYSSQSPGLIGTVKNCTQSIKERINKTRNFLSNYIQNSYSQIADINESLMKQVAFKTFIEGLGDFEVDQLNYFLSKQYEENNRSNRVEKKLSDWQEWASFIQKKRVRLRKANKFLLHTSCQFCLSPYFESYNPIQNCPQCHIRGHRFCLGLKNNSRCGRCTYLRLSNELKQKIPECFICNNINLAPSKISSLKFAHLFCLFFHSMWRVKDSRIQFREADENQTKTISIEKCKFCSKYTSYYTKCTICQSSCHSLCGFLNGCSFSVDDDGNIISLSCCWGSAERMSHLGWKRKYALNYQNMVFKKVREVQKLNRRGRKGSMKERKKWVIQDEQKGMEKEAERGEREHHEGCSDDSED